MKKFLLLFLLNILLFSHLITNVSAKFLSFPSDLYNFTDEGQRIEKIVLSPIRRNSVLKLSNEKYVHELIYYFSKQGFKMLPFHYIAFENGDYFVANNNMIKSRVRSNLDIPIISIFLVYENQFDIEKFRISLNSLINNELWMQIRNSAIRSVYDIEIRAFKVNVESKQLDFEASQEIPSLANVFQNIDYWTKIEYKLSVVFTEMNNNFPPGINIETGILIKNDGIEDVLLGKSMILQGRFEKDSIFYSNNNWQNTRTPFTVSTGGIRSSDSKAISFSLYTPLLPGKYTENMTVFLNEKQIGEVPISISIADVGQKVLRIKPTGYGYLIVRQEPSSSSPEISRAATGIPFIYTEEKNGFYKIKISDKEGWVSGRFVEVLKSK